MSNLGFIQNFVPSDEAKNASGGEFLPIPKGNYIMRITQADVVDTKAGDGKMVKLRLDVEGPSNVGRVIFDQILVASTPAKQEAVDIGRAKFGALCEACGFTDAPPSDTSQLIGHVVEAYIKIEPAKNGYDARNGVGSYSRAAAGSGSDASVDDDIPF